MDTTTVSAKWRFLMRWSISNPTLSPKSRIMRSSWSRTRQPHQVEIFENSSWSCVHGIERWRSNCGCNSGGHGEWNQNWRAPLRSALDWLRDTLAPRYEEKARSFLKDPWAARDEYARIILDRAPANMDRFLAQHAQHDLSDTDKITVWKLLELQRHAMLMYTSCGWFFDELSGIETVQVIQYAGRAVQLAADIFADPGLEPAFRGEAGRGQEQCSRARERRPHLRKVREGPQLSTYPSWRRTTPSAPSSMNTEITPTSTAMWWIGKTMRAPRPAR